MGEPRSVSEGTPSPAAGGAMGGAVRKGRFHSAPAGTAAAAPGQQPPLPPLLQPQPQDSCPSNPLPDSGLDSDGGTEEAARCAAHHHAPPLPLSLVPAPSPAGHDHHNKRQLQELQQQQQQQLSLSQERCYASDRPSSSRFRVDMMTARASTHAMDRYKALTRLCSHLGREVAAARITDPTDPQCWLGHELHELLWKVYEVGEALALFGTADFGEHKTNNSRAITSADYAYLLRLFADKFWGQFKTDFLEALPQALQDDALSVRGLLTTRFESSGAIHAQLLARVGQEGLGQQGCGGGSVSVFNSTAVHASPVNTVSQAHATRLHASAAAASKALQKSAARLPAILLASLAGAWLLRRAGVLGLVGLGGGSRRRGAGQLLCSEEGEDGRARGRGGRRHRLTNDERLMLAYDYADGAFKELQKSEANVALLERDWRLGHVRLANPFGGPHPPGMQRVDTAACEPRMLVHSQLGML